MTEREKLLKQLWDLNLGTMDKSYSVLIDFILADRRRIVQPLIEWNDWDKRGCFGNDYNNHLEGCKKAIRQAIELSGVAEERK